MQENNKNLNNFEKSKEFFGNIKLLLTVKSFNLEEIRKRYIASKTQLKGGSVERREPAEGGLVYVEIQDGEIIDQKILSRYKEARGIDYYDHSLVLSSENKIYLLELDKNNVRVMDHTWFSYIHTVKFNAERNRLLVASSGVDTILEIDTDKGNIQWEWNAWDEGLEQGVNPKTGETHYLTRNSERAEQLKSDGKNVIFVDNPKLQKLPTALRAAFINSAEYDKNGNILLTFFHDGDVKVVDKNTREIKTMLDGFQKPHGGRMYGEGFLVTDTAGGKLVTLLDQKVTVFDFSNLPGKDERVGKLEWLQTSHCINKNIITVDSNRTSLVFFNPDNEKIMIVPYNNNWAVQDFVVFDEDVLKIQNLIKDVDLTENSK